MEDLLDREKIRRDKIIMNYYGLVDVVVDKLLSHPNYKHFRFLRDDLIGNGYVSLINAIDTYKKGKGTTLVTYISMKVRGGSINLIRKYKRDTIPLVNLEDRTVKDLASEAIYNEKLANKDMEEEWELIDKFEPKDPIEKALYHTHIMGSATHAEIAEEFGVKRNTVVKKKARLLAKLKKQIEENQI